MSNGDFDDHGAILTFDFKTKEAAEHFKSWLCESGEQEYWEWMRERESDLEDDEMISVVEFDYWLPDGRIDTKLGRLT